MFYIGTNMIAYMANNPRDEQIFHNFQVDCSIPEK